MSEKSPNLGKEILEWDTEKIDRLIQKVTRDEELVDSDGRIKEPLGSLIFLRLVGRMPIRSALVLNELSKKEEKTIRSELADILGFSEGAPYVRLGEWLDNLVRIGLLEESTVKPPGKKRMKAYKLRETRLHRFCQNLHNFLSGSEFEWSPQHLLRLMKDKYQEAKVEGLDGTTKRLDPVEFIESIVRSGGSLEVAVDITEKILREKDKSKSEKSIREMIMEELKERQLWNVMERYIEKNPVGVKISDGEYYGKILTYDILKKIFLRHLASFGIGCLPSKVSKEILHPTLRSLMHDVEPKKQVAEKEILGKINSSIFSVYRETLEDIIQDPSKCVESSRNFLESAREKAKIDKPHEALMFLLSSFYWSMRSFYVCVGLLPAEDERAMVYLTRRILSSDSAGIEAESIEPKRAYEEIRSDLVSSLERKRIVLDHFSKCLELIKLDPRTAQQPIRKADLDFLFGFIDRFVSVMHDMTQEYGKGKDRPSKHSKGG